MRKSSQVLDSATGKMELLSAEKKKKKDTVEEAGLGGREGSDQK